MIKQVNKNQIMIEEKIGLITKQHYIYIDSEEGQKLIKEHNLEIDAEMQEV